MPLDRNAFFMGSHTEADYRAKGENMSIEERLAWANKTIKAFYGYATDDSVKIDRTAFSMRKHLV